MPVRRLGGLIEAETTQIVVERRTGPELAKLIPGLAALRVEVFRAWPYLYDGDLAYEEAYLQTYAHSPSAAVIAVWHDDELVGASTCLRLTEETANVQAPFLAHDLDPADYFYFGESVLRPAWRGRGIGVAFFREREAQARSASSCGHACFCSVVRPADHRLRPSGYVPLDGFWSRRGYTRRPELVCEMAWTDLGEEHPTVKQLVFWTKKLDRGPAR